MQTIRDNHVVYTTTIKAVPYLHSVRFGAPIPPLGPSSKTAGTPPAAGQRLARLRDLTLRAAEGFEKTENRRSPVELAGTA